MDLRGKQLHIEACCCLEQVEVPTYYLSSGAAEVHQGGDIQ